MRKKPVTFVDEQICIRFPQDHITEIDNLVKNHEYDSRSSVIRRAVKEFLDHKKVIA